MKLKVFYLGLLSTFVMATTQTDGLQRRVVQAPQAEAKLKEHEQIASQVAPHIDLNAHGNPVAAMGDISAKIGEHPGAPTGTTANHKIADLHTRLGGGGATAHEKVTGLLNTLGASPAPSGDTAHHKVADLHTRLGTAAVPGPDQSSHGKLTDLLGIQGAVTYGATVQGINDGNVGNAANNLAGSAIANEEAILRRLKTAIQANHAAHVAIQGQASTKTTNTPAGPLVAGDFGAANAATNLQDFLAELGW